MFDALTNPAGFKATIQQWPKHPAVRQIARARGFTIPAPNFSEPTAVPARALLNHGVWRAWCPDCPYAAEDVWKGRDLFWCMKCGNKGCGGAWRPLLWPENLAEIEAALAPYPAPAQNWEPWGEARDLTAEAEAWGKKAGVMIDPERGLTSNDIGGADDPETYTTPVLAVTNAIIASSDANVDKGDLRYFRQFMPANPAAANYWLQSDGTDSAAWVARATAVLAALGFTPANKAGEVFTGLVTFLKAVGINLGGTAPGGLLYDQDTVMTRLRAHASQFGVYDAADGTQIFRAANAETSPYWKNSAIWHAGNDGAGSGLDADTVDGLQATQLARLAGASDFSVAPTIGGGAIWHSLNDGAGSGLDADLLDGVNGASFARVDAATNFTTVPTIEGDAIAKIASGTYVGNNGSARQITTGFVCKHVIITAISGTNGIRAELMSATATNNFAADYNLSTGATSTIACDASALHASDGFIVDAAGLDGTNSSGVTYYYTAFG